MKPQTGLFSHQTIADITRNYILRPVSYGLTLRDLTMTMTHGVILGTQQAERENFRAIVEAELKTADSRETGIALERVLTKLDSLGYIIDQ